jgi:predicted amidohydrolase YtcJ
MHSCDTFLKGTVITMDPERQVFMDGYVAIGDGKVLAAGPAGDCEYQANEMHANSYAYATASDELTHSDV